MRIWHQSAVELDSLPQYAESLSRRYAAIVAPDTEVVLHGVPSGTYGSSSPAQALADPAERQRVATLVLEQVRQAERQRFDAVMIASFFEPALREARASLRIPVTSMAESSYLAGCSVACQIGVVTISQAGVLMLQEGIARHGLESRVSPALSLETDVDEFEVQRAFSQPDKVRAAFENCCRKAIAAGADVLIPGEGVLNELAVHLGIREVDAVAVLDAVAITAMHTEMLVRAYRGAGLRTGRRWGSVAIPLEQARPSAWPTPDS